jgi:hypothetical protein
MSTNEKIRLLKKNIIYNESNSFEFKLNDVLSFCESEIESLFLLELINYFEKFEKTKYNTGMYSDIDFIISEIDPFEPNINILRQQELINRINRFQFQKEGFFYYKYIGFRVNKNSTELVNVDDLANESNFFYFQFEVMPQFEVETENGKKRIDVAIIANKCDPYNNSIIETKKIALECDGFDYHSKPEQYRKDKERERHLKSIGWTDVLRYSGSEIYRIDNNFDKTGLIIEEIIKILTL